MISEAPTGEILQRSPRPGGTVNRPQAEVQRVLRQPVTEFLERPGKKIRSRLVWLGFDLANNPSANSDGVPVACEFVEQLHAGSLIIDDIQDRAESRRGRPSLHTVVGVPAAINMGNWLYFAGLEQLTQLALSDAQRCEILGRALMVTRQCHEGQALDLSLRIDSVPLVEVRSMVESITAWKTGALTGLAAWLGAAVAGASREQLQRISDFGCLLGSVLQMQNDCTDLRLAAKQSGGSQDLANRRVTWPWAWAAEQLTRDAYEALLARVSDQDLGGQSQLAGRLLACTQEIARVEIRGRLTAAAQLLEVCELSAQQRHRAAGVLSDLELRYA